MPENNHIVEIVVFDAAVQPLAKVDVDNSSALYKQIFDRIREWLRTGKLKEGEPLPSERELAQMFDVSRVPVREALKVLEFVGIVQQVRGKGVFVKKISANSIIDTIDFVMMNSSHTMLELFEVRQGIETQAALLAAERRTEQDLAVMASSLVDIEKQMDDEPLSADHSLDFHSAIIAASHNSALIEINQFLTEWLRYMRMKYIYPSVGNEKGRTEHRELFELIKAKDSLGAAEKMRAHLTRARDIIARAVAETESADVQH